MTNRVRIIRREAVPACGSFEVRFGDGRASKFFYWDDLPSRRLRSEILTRDQALELERLPEPNATGMLKKPADLDLAVPPEPAHLNAAALLVVERKPPHH